MILDYPAGLQAITKVFREIYLKTLLDRRMDGGSHKWRGLVVLETGKGNLSPWAHPEEWNHGKSLLVGPLTLKLLVVALAAVGHQYSCTISLSGGVWRLTYLFEVSKVPTEFWKHHVEVYWMFLYQNLHVCTNQNSQDHKVGLGAKLYLPQTKLFLLAPEHVELSLWDVPLSTHSIWLLLEGLGKVAC